MDQRLRATLLAHRRWLNGERDGQRADLTLQTLRNLDLRGVDLSNAKLTGMQVLSCRLSGAKLVDADLFGANLIGTDFIRADRPWRSSACSPAC